MVDTKMGKVFATEKGMTLYTFDKDTKGKSNCDGDCLKMWPAYGPFPGTCLRCRSRHPPIGSVGQ